ncbi:O-methyltransferase [Polluticoccus soli]|uniref:O-methyltransferase n=1 Tax=Polluticoccus soli TaxID=3034150 RepID=UPI0023E0A2EC|nr:O-methyltransferase [Flavipsychrobacter sp. JY13-12]
MDNSIFEKTDHYINSLFAPEDETLAGIEQSLLDGNSNMPLGGISPNQGKLLQVLAKMCNAKTILELGTLGAYSTIWLARALPAGGKVITIEYDENNIAVAKTNIAKAGLTDKIEIRQGKAIDILQQLKTENKHTFDMVFMDADKPPYTEYFELALSMSRPGTVIVADNVVRNGKVLNENSSDAAVQGVQRFNKTLSENKAVTATILQMVGLKEYDGMAIAVVN